jgi:hypothetical protein
MESTAPRPPLETTRKWLRFWQVLTLILFGWFLGRAIDSHRDDFLAYYAAGTRALHGLTPYVREETPYRYLPATAFFFIPFALFPVAVSRLVFFALNFGAAALLYSAIRKRLGDLATFLILALFFKFHNHDFANSQINPIMLLLFFYWWENREKNLARASLAFSIFGSFKVVQFALGLPLLIRGKWREITWIGGWTLALNLVPITLYARGFHVFDDWYAEAKLIDDPVMLPNIQSIQSALWWILEGHVSVQAFAIGIRIFQAALLLFVAFFAPRRNREAWMVASTLAITVMISPLAWKHGYLLFIPLVVLWFFEDPRFVEFRTRLLYGIAFLGLVAAPDLIGAWNKGFADRLYLVPWTGVLLVLLGPIFARRAERAPIAT